MTKGAIIFLSIMIILSLTGCTNANNSNNIDTNSSASQHSS